MTRDDVIRMAREAGFRTGYGAGRELLNAMIATLSGP